MILLIQLLYLSSYSNVYYQIVYNTSYLINLNITYEDY